MRDPASGTMDAVFTAYAISTVDAGTRARHLNELAMKKLLRECGLPGAPETIRRADVNDTIARTWFANAKLRANAEPDPAKKHTIYRSANSFDGRRTSSAASALGCASLAGKPGRPTMPYAPTPARKSP
jgi:hypothetical protein